MTTADQCPPCAHNSLSGDEGPVVDLPGGLPVRWTIDAAQAIADGTWPEISARLDAEDSARAARLTSATALAEAAAWYCSVGVSVFPLIPGGKRPATRHGLHDASTDPERVLRWWLAEPQANIGIRTGLLFDCIDVDGPIGYRSLDQLRQDGLVPPVLGRAITPRGGCHLYIAPTGDGNTAGLRPSLDFRGASGYVVAPPSRSIDTGKQWLWAEPMDFAAAQA